jgi:hypothetical protein
MNSKALKVRIAAIAAITLLAFAVLMGMRDEIESIWLRAAVAGAAGALAGLMLVLIGRRSTQ